MNVRTPVPQRLVRNHPILLALVAALLVAASPAAASPVATSDGQYQVLGRVFPDPMAGCQNAGGGPCSPTAKGNVPATQFIQWQEQIDGLTYLNSKPEWRRFMEVWPLDGKLGPAAGTDERTAFPGNDLGRFEFKPNAEFQSAGNATTTVDRARNDLLMVRVTDETVPDAGKKRYLVSMGMHGIERAGVEGGTRALEDLVTAMSSGRSGEPILPKEAVAGAPTLGEVLRRAIVYFVYPNPDGWRRGSITEGGAFFQRYNGNGMDVNRDWPDVGFLFRPYSPLSEPESRAFSSALKDIRDGAGAFGAGVDLHGMAEADALSYTLIGHGRHDFAKDRRLVAASMNIHRATQQAVAWSPLVQDDTKPQGGAVPCAPGAIGDVCAQIYGQTWGTVYDTINYTTTGAMGDWLDSPQGLNADGLDNEMAFSHLDRNVAFDPQGEQMHVDGNKALIWGQITTLLAPPEPSFKSTGRKGFVVNSRLADTEKRNQGDAPPGTRPQDDVGPVAPDPAQSGPDGLVFPIDVKAGNGIFNGGMRVDVRTANVQGLATGTVALRVQCQNCDLEPGEPDSEGWRTVQEDYNQSPVYLQAGVTAAINRPQARARDGKPVLWRAVVDSQATPAARMWVDYTSGPATLGGSTGGNAPPLQSSYDIANTDFFADLNRYISDPAERFRVVDPLAVASGRQSLSSFDTIVLSDLVTPAGFTQAERDRWLGALRDWASAGGTLVLTDAALGALPSLTKVPASAVKSRKNYVGQISFATADGADTLKDPLNAGVALEGARFNSGMRRQMYEPVPLGYAIQTPDDSDAFESPQWDVDKAAFTGAGGRIAATSASSSNAADYTRVTTGEIAVGQGRVRILGAALPQPTEKFDHTLGLEPYSLTYTGYIMLRNLTESRQRGPLPAGAAAGLAPSSADQLRALACRASNGFASASVRPRGRRVQIRFRRLVSRPVSVDVFQTSRGRRVLRSRLVARFPRATRSFTWNGRSNLKRRVSDGTFYVRMRVRAPGGQLDVRRPVLLRKRGRYSRRPSYYTRRLCGVITSAKLRSPVFGGRPARAQRLAYRLGAPGLVTVQVLRGGRVVRAFPAARRDADRTYRLTVRSRGLRRGVYRFRITVRTAGGSATRTLTARRL